MAGDLRRRCIFSVACYVVLAALLLTGLSGGAQAQPLAWKATHADAIQAVGAETRLRAMGGGHWVFLAQPLARSFTLEFEERTGGSPPEVRLLWNFWPRAAVEYLFGSGYTHRLTFRPDGTVLAEAGKRKVAVKVTGKGTGKAKGKGIAKTPRRWRLAVRPAGAAVLYLNGGKVATLPALHANEAIPALAWKIRRLPETRPRAVKKQSDAIKTPGDAVKILTGLRLSQPDGALRFPSPRVLQWPRPGFSGGPAAGQRFTILAAAHLKLPPMKEMARLAQLFREIEKAAGRPFDQYDVVVTAFFDPRRCCWSGVYSGDDRMGFVAFTSAAKLAPHQDTAHEMGHAYGCAGGFCDYRQHRWLWEGFASFLGFWGWNLVEGRPAWAFDLRWTHPFRFPGRWQAGGINDPPLALHRDRVGSPYAAKDAVGVWDRAAYSKGYALLALLAAKVGLRHVTDTIRANAGKKVTSTGFIAELERRSGKALEHLLPGWVVPGAYRGLDFSSARDSDGDGLADFQELARGLDPRHHDTDRDGQTDYEELAANTDPHDRRSRIANKPWRIDGFPGDFPEGALKAAITVKRAASTGKKPIWRRLRLGLLAGNPVVDLAGVAQHFAPSGRLPAVVDGFHFLRIILAGPGKKRLKASWKDGALNELAWLDGHKGPPLPRKRFQAACSRHGCEFRLAADVFPPGLLTAEISRLRLKNGAWSDITIRGSVRR
ncbi:MAG: hypothetical protein V3S64_13585 [bacterium]